MFRNIKKFEKLKKSSQTDAETNSIPHKIHLFWSGSIIPEQNVQCIISFLKNLPDVSWKIYLWLTNPNDLYKASFFKSLDKDQFPSSLTIKNVNELLSDEVLRDIERNPLLLNYPLSFMHLKQIIKRELIGLGNPAAAKDGLAPLILFVHGGYFFDMDAKAFAPLQPPAASYGILLINQGKIVSALAAEKGHRFCLLSLKFLIENYFMLHQNSTINSIKPLHQIQFFESQILRDRKNKERPGLTIRTSGFILLQAYNRYMEEECFNINILKRDFALNIKFPILSCEENKLIMGIQLHLKQDGNWREDKKFESFEEDNLNYKHYKP